MAGVTITRAQLGEAVYQEVGLSRNESAELLEAVLSQISDALARGETVKLPSFVTSSGRPQARGAGGKPREGGGGW